MRSFLKLQSVDPGFRAEGVLTAGVQLPGHALRSAAQPSVAVSASLSRIAALPGVQPRRAPRACRCRIPCIGTSFWRVDRPKPADGQLPSGQVRPVTPGFFKTMGIPQVAGRDFSDVRHRWTRCRSRSSARSSCGSSSADGSPLGRRLRVNFDHASGRDDVEWTIVGVVGNTRSIARRARSADDLHPTDAASRRRHARSSCAPQQDPLVARHERDRSRSRDGTGSARRDPHARRVVGNTIARPRAMSMLVAVFALVGLALAAVGVYGVMAYSVRERTQEIGVRMALGATRASVFRLMVGQALRLVLVGVADGLVAAALLTRLLERLLYDVEPLDPWTFGGTALVLLVVATVASYVPARRGMRMAPVDALRTN